MLEKLRQGGVFIDARVGFAIEEAWGSEVHSEDEAEVAKVALFLRELDLHREDRIAFAGAGNIRLIRSAATLVGAAGLVMVLEKVFINGLPDSLRGMVEFAPEHETIRTATKWACDGPVGISQFDLGLLRPGATGVFTQTAGQTQLMLRITSTTHGLAGGVTAVLRPKIDMNLMSSLAVLLRSESSPLGETNHPNLQCILNAGWQTFVMLVDAGLQCYPIPGPDPAVLVRGEDAESGLLIQASSARGHGSYDGILRRLNFRFDQWNSLGQPGLDRYRLGIYSESDVQAVLTANPLALEASIPLRNGFRIVFSALDNRSSSLH